MSSCHRVVLFAECSTTARAQRSAFSASVILRSRLASSWVMSLSHLGTSHSFDDPDNGADREALTDEPCGFAVRGSNRPPPRAERTVRAYETRPAGHSSRGSFPQHSPSWTLVERPSSDWHEPAARHLTPYRGSPCRVASAEIA